MRIVFLHHGLEIDGNSIDAKPLGGTETALVSVAKALAAHPDLEVSIFTRTPATASFSGVRFSPLSQFHAWAATHPIDCAGERSDMAAVLAAHPCTLARLPEPGRAGPAVPAQGIRRCNENRRIGRNGAGAAARALHR